MSFPSAMRRLPRALGTARGIVATRTFHTSRSSMAIMGKGSVGEDVRLEEEAARRQLLADRERERMEAIQIAAAMNPEEINEDEIPESELVLPPSRFTLAPTAEEAASLDYVPAEKMEDLDRITSLENWWDQPGHWGPESAIPKFAVQEGELQPEVNLLLTRQAVIEALVVKSLGKPSELADGWAIVPKEVVLKTLSVSLEVKDGGLAISGDVESVLEALRNTEAAEVSQTTFTAEEAAEITQKFDSVWRDISLQDPVFAFAVAKRIYQLTGKRINDARLSSCKTVGQLLVYINTPEKRKSVVEAVRTKNAFASLPNVKVYSRRVTPIDRRINDGSWKKIEEELRKRKLPVIGHEDLPDFAERSWINVKY